MTREAGASLNIHNVCKGVDCCINNSPRHVDAFLAELRELNGSPISNFVGAIRIVAFILRSQLFSINDKNLFRDRPTV